MKLDVRGEICPYPMTRALAALKKLSGDEELKVLTDHPPALSTIPWEGAKMGYRAEIQESASAEWTITLRRVNQRLEPLEVMQSLRDVISKAS